MKFLAVAFALVAAVSADADADAYYGYAGYGLGYAGYGGYLHHGLGYAGYHGLGYAYGGYPYANYFGAYHGLKAAPCVNDANIAVPCARKKRDADADPALLYGALGYPHAYGGYALGAHAYGGYPYAYGAYPYAYGSHVTAGKPLPHGVALTPFGAIHSSHVGICTNVDGEKVDC